MSDLNKQRLSLGAIAGMFVSICAMFGWLYDNGKTLESRLTKIETLMGCHIDPHSCGNSLASK